MDPAAYIARPSIDGASWMRATHYLANFGESWVPVLSMCTTQNLTDQIAREPRVESQNFV